MTKKNTITLDDASVKRLALDPQDAGIRTKIHIESLCTPDVAKHLGVDHLIYREHKVPDRSARRARKTQVIRGIREGFSEIDLDLEIGQATMRLTPNGMAQHSFRRTVDKLTKFVIRKSDKGGLKMRFTAQDTGLPYELVEYLCKAGTAPGKLELEVEADKQLTLDGAGKKRKAKPKAEPEQQTLTEGSGTAYEQMMAERSRDMSQKPARKKASRKRKRRDPQTGVGV